VRFSFQNRRIGPRPVFRSKNWTWFGFSKIGPGSVFCASCGPCWRC
jgi:hypothetical protein